MGNPEGIYVQVLPVVIPQQSSNNSNKSLESQASECKILLCKWASGDFKDRYTGLIRPLARKEYDTIICHTENGKHPEKQQILLQLAKELIPSPLKEVIADIRLVGLLRFEDSPVYDEYIYLANLIAPSNKIESNEKGSHLQNYFRQDIMFGENTCYWYSWDQIPYHEMPADDELWYPKVLQQQKKVKGSFTFGGWSEKNIKSFELETVEQVD